LTMNGSDDVRLREVEQIVIALERSGVVLELAAVRGFIELEGLNHGAHGSIQDHDPAAKVLLDCHAY